MKEEKYRKGQVVFRQGDSGDCMYSIRWGSVGVFANYGEKNEKQLAELRAGDYFGEMELLDHASRSATVVSLERGTVLNRISEDEFDEYDIWNEVEKQRELKRQGQFLHRGIPLK